MTSQSLVHRDPFLYELSTFRNSFDDMVNQMLSRHAFGAPTPTPGGWAPELESFLDQGKLHLRFNLAGIAPSDVHVELHGNQLTITGERKSQSSSTHAHFLQREFSYGSFQRTLMLPETVKTENLEATFQNGILELSAPVSEKAMPRKIEVRSVNLPPQSISTSKSQAA